MKKEAREERKRAVDVQLEVKGLKRARPGEQYVRSLREKTTGPSYRESSRDCQVFRDKGPRYHKSTVLIPDRTQD